MGRRKWTRPESESERERERRRRRRRKKLGEEEEDWRVVWGEGEKGRKGRVG
jgi:hypothetical protein